MDWCFPQFMKNHLIETCEICYSPCSIFEIKVIKNNTPLCNECYVKICNSQLNPENKKAQNYNEKCKWYSKNELYSLRGPYVTNRWEQIVGDIVDNKIKMRIFLKDVCFLCKQPVSTLKETYINDYIYHYECSKLCIL